MNCIINNELANEFINAKQSEIFYSDKFGDMKETDVMKQFSFWLQFEPKVPEFDYFVDGNHRLELGFNFLPKNVYMIYCKVKINDGKSIHQVQSASYSTASRNMIRLSGFDDINELLKRETIFSVEIQITKVITFNSGEIPKSDWKCYGIE